MRRKTNGQSVVEFAIVLPLLLLLFAGLLEIGQALHSYALVMAANREGVRFAARGRFDDTTVAQRVITAGGVTTVGGGSVPRLRTTGPQPNTGIIITHIPIQDDGTVLSTTVYVTGTVAFTDTRPIRETDSRIDIEEIVNRNAPTTVAINNLREEAGYERLTDEIVVLEVFYAHTTLLRFRFFALHDPFMLYTHSAMRVFRDSRID